MTTSGRCPPEMLEHFGNTRDEVLYYQSCRLQAWNLNKTIFYRRWFLTNLIIFQNQFSLKNFALLPLDETCLFCKIIISLIRPKNIWKHVSFVALYAQKWTRQQQLLTVRNFWESFNNKSKVIRDFKENYFMIVSAGCLYSCLNLIFKSQVLNLMLLTFLFKKGTISGNLL